MGRRIGAGIFVVAGLMLGACSKSTGHSGSASFQNPGQDVAALCDQYGTKIGKESANPVRTTAGAVTASLRQIHAATTPWASRPPTEVVAHCSYPWSGPITKTTPTTHCPDGAIGVTTPTPEVFIDKSGSVSAVPAKLRESPC